ncbi:hypothetical protein B0A48_16799 [Cryoendolithus antarcticus]|uniref:Uncharacterized protein n=1 Tax=Cryoendolithus antarcticus TaxID=1507870 RepID=A0A1V8SE03_9PEZI|nr:hypothetical protein B0A48_16799 [Cryoendolithus antarcticus]
MLSYVATVTTIFFTLLVILLCQVLFKLLVYCHCFREHYITSDTSLYTAESFVEETKPKTAAMPGTQLSKKERKRIKLRDRDEKRKAEQERSALSELVNGRSGEQRDSVVEKGSAAASEDALAAGTKSMRAPPMLTRGSPACSTDVVKAELSKAPAAATSPVPQISVTQTSADTKQEEHAAATPTKAPEPASAQPDPSTPAVQTPKTETQRETAQPTRAQTPKISSSESTKANDKKPANDTSLKRKPSKLESTKSEKIAKQEEEQPSMKTEPIAVGGSAAGTAVVSSSATEEIAMSEPIPTETSLKRKLSNLESTKSDKIARQESEQLSVDTDRPVPSNGLAVTTAPITATPKETSITASVPSAPQPSHIPIKNADASTPGQPEKSKLAVVPTPQLLTPEPTPEPESKPMSATQVLDAGESDTLVGEAGEAPVAMSQPGIAEATDSVESRDHENVTVDTGKKVGTREPTPTATVPHKIEAKQLNDEDTLMGGTEPISDGRGASSNPKPLDWRAGLQAAFASLHIKTSHGRFEDFQRLTLAFHCSLCPDKFQPPRRILSGNDLQAYARELSVLFLRRYGSWIWPRSRTCAPHLIDRGLSYKRHGRLSNNGRSWYAYEGLEVPRKGDFGDVARSALRKRVQYWFEHLLTFSMVWEKVGGKMSMEVALLNLLAGRAKSAHEARMEQAGGVPERSEKNEPEKPLSATATVTATPMSTATVAQEPPAAKPRTASPAKSTASSDYLLKYNAAYSNSATYIPPVPVPVLNTTSLPPLTPARSATSSEEDRLSNDSRATDPYANSPEDQEMADEPETHVGAQTTTEDGLSAYEIDLQHMQAVRLTAKFDFEMWEKGPGNKELQSKVLRRLAQTWFPGDRYAMPKSMVED